MHIDAFREVMNACRYCFMCRHLSAVGNVSFREADTPRGRALVADTVRMKPDAARCPDFARAIYESDLSGANRFHCVSSYDEIGLQLALRRDLVDAGNVPDAVAAVADALEKSAAWTVEGKADTLYFVDPQTEAHPASFEAARKLFKAAGVDFATLRGGCIGKGLAVLGYAERAKRAMLAFVEAVAKSGAKTLVAANPAAYDALVNDFSAAGVSTPFEVKHISGFLADLAAAGKLRFAAAAGAPVAYLESDYLKNYAKYDGPARLLDAMKVERAAFGTNPEESHTAGEGALVLDRIAPELAAKLARRVAELAEPGQRLVVASAHSARLLAAAGLDVATLEQLAGERLCS